jgi:DHA1 family tetracycline resistance protein-like MFS transporter
MGSLTSLNSLMAVAAPFIGTPLLAEFSHLPSGDWRIGAPFFMSAALALVALVLAARHFARQPLPAGPPVVTPGGGFGH